MIKFEQGWIENPETGEAIPVVVKSAFPNKLTDIAIGGGIVLVGIAYLTYAAFKNGAAKFERAEYDTLASLGLITGRTEPKE